MLDTNVLSEIMRNPRCRATDRIEAAGADAVCTSAVVVAELRCGAEKRGSARLMRRVEELLSDLPVLSFSVPGNLHYGRLRADLERRGTPIGSNDLIIAAQALQLDATLVTANLAEFDRIPALRVENWLWAAAVRDG